MGVAAGPKVVTEGLVFSLDARNSKTYDEIPGITDHGISDWYCFRSGTATYSAIYPNTKIIEIDANGNETVMVSTGSDPQRGTFTTTAGRRYYGTKAVHIMKEGEQENLAPVSFAGTYFAHYWINRNSPKNFYAYAPQDDTTLEFFDNNTAGGVTGTVTATYNITKGSTTSFTSTAVNTWQFFKADKPIIMTAGSGADRTILAPATQYIYKRRNAYNITINNTAPSTSSTYVTYDTSLPVVTMEIADGAGGDSSTGIGYEYLSDTYSWGNSLSDYQLVAPYADTTVTVSYWANGQWNVGEVHSLNGTQTSPAAAFRDGTNGFGVNGSNIAGTAAFLASGANLWKFEGTQPFALIINDTVDDEERLLGWMSNKYLRTSSNVTQSFVNLIDKNDRRRMKMYGKDLTTTIEYAGARLSASDYIEFDGVDDYIKSTFSTVLGQAVTYCGWLYSTETTSTYRNFVDSVSQRPMIWWDPLGKIEFDAGYYRTSEIYRDVWVYVALSKPSGPSSPSYYVNGDFVGSGTAYTVQSVTPYFFNRNNSQSWKGNGGLIQIYNRALTASEIQQNFNATRSRFGI